jgi:hypothetical protein
MQKGTRVCIVHRFEPTSPSAKRQYANWKQFNAGLNKCGVLLDNVSPGSWDVADIRLVRTKRVVSAYGFQLKRQGKR